jgi:hypothetical protein
MATKRNPVARSRKGTSPKRKVPAAKKAPPAKAKRSVQSRKTTPNIGRGLRQMPAEPLLPIEKKLIAWSLCLGAVLLVILVLATEALFS